MSKAQPNMARIATQFEHTKTTSGRKAFKAYCAGLNTFAGNEIAILAPSMEVLKEEWERMAGGQHLHIPSVQQVWITEAGEAKDDQK